jgi:spore photoproduct lyase
VGKSDNVDFLLELDHRGHTVVCWSVSGQTQSTRIERGTGPMARRIKAARKCQQAGYRVRFRLSPIVPVRNWQAENRELIERLFAATRPDIVTFEPLRFLDYAMVQECLDTSLLDPEFLEVMKDAQGKPHRPGGEIPDDYRKKVSAFIIAELERVSPETPYAFCREARDLWDHFALDFSRHGQSPDNYVCNCGPTSAPGNPLLR